MRITHFVAVVLMTVTTAIRAQAPGRSVHHAQPSGRRCEVMATHRLPSRSASADRRPDSIRSSRPTKDLYISACDAVFKSRVKSGWRRPWSRWGQKSTSGTPK